MRLVGGRRPDLRASSSPAVSWFQADGQGHHRGVAFRQELLVAALGRLCRSRLGGPANLIAPRNAAPAPFALRSAAVRRSSELLAGRGACWRGPASGGMKIAGEAKALPATTSSPRVWSICLAASAWLLRPPNVTGVSSARRPKRNAQRVDFVHGRRVRQDARTGALHRGLAGRYVSATARACPLAAGRPRRSPGLAFKQWCASR